MANYNNPNIGMPQTNQSMMMGQAQPLPMQFPYGNNNMLLSNTPYDNYMGNRPNNSQNLLSNQFLKCRPVSSREQARAFQIDLDGSLWVFTDLGNNKIYTKQVNNDGTATFRTYAFVQDQTPYNTNAEFVTKDEFNKVIQALTAAIQANNTGPAQSNENKQTNNESASILSF